MANEGAGADSGNVGNAGTGSGNASADIERIVNETLNKAIGPAIARVLGSQLPRAIEAAIAASAPKVKASESDETGGVVADAGNGAGASDKLTMKTLSSQLEAMQRQLKASQEATQSAQRAARDARLRADVRAAMAAKIGADNPALDLLMDSLVDVKKRFDVDESGAAVARFKREWGDEVLPLAKALDEMALGELKPYLPARSGNLPPSQVGGRGQPQQRNNGQSVPTMPFFMNDMLAEIGKDRPELAASLEAQAINSRPSGG